MKRYLEESPLGLDDTGGACVVLAGNAASFFAGQNLHVNGGMTAQ